MYFTKKSSRYMLEIYDQFKTPGDEFRRQATITEQKFACEYTEKDLEEAVVFGVIDNKASTEQLQVLIFKDKSNVPVRFLKKFAKLEPQLVGSNNNVEEVEAYLYAL